MRIGILALTTLAFIEPAMAREPSQRHPGASRQHHAQPHQARHSRVAKSRRARHVRTARRAVVVERVPVFLDPRNPRAAEPLVNRSTVLVERPVPRARLRVEPATRLGPAAPDLVAPRRASSGALDAAIARHAQANGVPEHLVRRVIVRESRYNARAVGRGGTMGLMQIKHATARSMGYSGSARGLLDAETNLTYAVRYLAGAYRAAGGNPNRAVAYYASGYHGRGVNARRRAAR